MTGRKCALDAAGEVGFIVFKTRLEAGELVGGRYDKGSPTETEALFTALLQAAEMMPNQQS